MPGQITGTYRLPPHRMTKALSRATESSRNVEGVNAHALYTNSYISWEQWEDYNCELEILYYNNYKNYPP